ncbi:hypothetical protein MRB53_032236 [Persea americana]|uniref:Uncharacterized protein n=1 Tax=Persea americana TaxID=3435 RepID=A0ACC2KSA0_PERAE|nr:hypothetical protein MRB53_032236 [Persea americana]
MGDVEIPIWLKGLPFAPEYHPTETEFADPIAYISKIEKEASAFGICKIIPPLPKPSKRYVLSNLNKSLSKCSDLGADAPGCSSSQMGSEDRGNEGEARAVFTTRHQELGLCPKRLKGPAPIRQLAIQKQVWQSGQVYTLDQFESKSRAFARSHLSGVKEVNPLVVESLFWKAASEKPIYVEYANDVPGSGFGEPEGPFRYIRKRKRRRRFDRKYQERVGCDKPEVDHPIIDETFSADKAVPCLSTLLSDESSRLSMHKSLTTPSGSDKEGTAGWKISNSPWNLQVIAQSRGSLTRFMVDDIPGVTSPMIYIGMLFSWFAWHVEDHELHSLNFLHMGAPKTWYAVPSDYAFAFEEVVRVQGYGEHLDRLAALTLLGEKTTLLSPEVVVSSGIPCCRLVQHPGEFVVTFPRAYHIGFSHGFNCGEAANFATPQWLKVAKEAAVRRAAMNYLPMLSHQQLLYLLTISFVSRVPRALLPGVRSSRLRDRKKEEREILVKKAFLDDAMTENQRLVVLLEKSSTSYAVLWDPDLLPSPINCPTFPSASPEPSSLLVGAKPLESEKDGSNKEIALDDAATTSCEKISSIDWQDNNHNKKVESMGPYVEITDSLYGDDDDLPCGLHVDSGTLACVACGLLGFPFMSVIQPSERALEELFCEESGVNQTGMAIMKSLKLPTQNVDKVVEDFDLDDMKEVAVEFRVQGERDETQKGNLSPKCREHTPVTEVPKGGRNFELVEKDPLECSSDTAKTSPEVIADKELKQTSMLCHPSRASSSTELNKSIHSLHNISLLPGFSQIPVDLLTSSPTDGGNEIYQCSNITDKAKLNEMEIDNSNESGGNPCLKVHATVKKDLRRSVSVTGPYYETEGSLREPTLSGGKVNGQWNTSNVFLRPRIFCLEHALEIEELLHCRGGANVLIICHSDYPKIKAHAPSIAEEVGVHFNCEDILLETASQAELDLINISVDDETEERGEDWTSKLDLNLRHSINIRKLSPSKKEWHALPLGGLFSEQIHGLTISTLQWKSRKPRTHHKGTDLGHSKMQDNLHMKKGKDKMVSHSGANVFAENQVSGSISKPCDVTQACRSRGRGRPRKHFLKESNSGNETTPNDKSDPKNKSSENTSSQPPENDSAQAGNLSSIADPSPKSSEALAEILTTHETNMLDQMCDSITHTVDIPMGEVPENQQPMQTPDLTSLAGEVCYPKRSTGLPCIEISEVPSAEETQKAAKVCEDSSSVSLLAIDTPEVESSKMQQQTSVAGKICDCTTILTVDNSRSKEEIYTAEGTPMVAELCDSAKSPPPPALVDSLAGMQREIQTVGEAAMKDASCDSETSADIATVIISMAEHPDKESEILTTDGRSSGDDYSSMKPANLLPIAVSDVESSEIMLDIQTAREDCSLTGGVCNSSKPTGGAGKANANPILVYSRVRKGQRKSKGFVDEKTDAQESCFGFIRSPCEGLRPRAGRKAAGEMNASSTVEENEPRKKAKMMPRSLGGGGRVKEKHKVSYKCDLGGCRMSFMTKGELQLHKRNRCTHEGCGKRFSSHKYAIHHERVHSDDRPLKCPMEGCNMSFKWAWARTEHVRVHTGERPYQCKVAGCDLTFRFVSDFSRHRRRTGHSVN